MSVATQERDLHLAELKKKTITDLNSILKELKVDGVSGLRKQDLIFKILEAQSGKDRDGDITKLCQPGELWSPRAKADAIGDIESRAHTYYVLSARGRSDVLRHWANARIQFGRK